MIYFAVARKFVDKKFIKSDQPLDNNQWVLVETEIGLIPFQVKKEVNKSNQDKAEEILLIKESLPDDVDFDEKKEREEQMLESFKEKIKKFDLNMKPIEALLTQDDRIIFYFTAPERVDFRRLVSDLSSEYREPIRLQHISPRVATMIRGAVGPCGRNICCRFLIQDHIEVTSDIVESQGLQGMDKGKLSGACGRLACCLEFEKEEYEKMMEDLPEIGEELKAKEGQTGEVIDINPLKGSVLIRYEDGSSEEIQIN